MRVAEPRLKALMTATLDGDSAAYRALLTALTPYLRSYFARRLKESADAEDLVQETLIAIHTRRMTYDPGQPFTAWLHAIARYKLIDYLRRGQLRRTLPLEKAENIMPDEAPDASSAGFDVEQLLETLPEAPRTLIRHIKLEGLSTAETAALMGLSESAVKVGVHRGLKKLAALVRGGRG